LRNLSFRYPGLPPSLISHRPSRLRTVSLLRGASTLTIALSLRQREGTCQGEAGQSPNLGLPASDLPRLTSDLRFLTSDSHLTPARPPPTLDRHLPARGHAGSSS